MKCTVCYSKNISYYQKAKDYEYFSSKKVYYYFICKSCKVIFLKDPPIKNLKKIYPNYYYSYNQEPKNSFIFKYILLVKEHIDKKLFLKYLKKVKNKKIKVLDIGGGDGYTANKVTNLCSNILKVDVLDPIVSKNPINNKKVNFLNFKAEDIKYKVKEKYDFIIMLNLIEHLNDPKNFMNDLKLIMKKNSYCLIKTPNSLSFNNFIFKKFYWGGLHTPRHFNIFNHKNISKIIPQEFAIEKINFTQGALQWHASILGFLIKKKLIKKNIPSHLRPEKTFLAIVFSLIDILVLKYFKLTDQFFLIIKKNRL